MRRMASSITARGVAATVGVGHKLGRSITHKFAHERYTVAILARDLGRLSRFSDEIAREETTQVFVIRIDCPNSKSIREEFEGCGKFAQGFYPNAYQESFNLSVSMLLILSLMGSLVNPGTINHQCY
ncbi:hypothetical protein GQ457_07G010980 [Hibiscus cannabinus]